MILENQSLHHLNTFGLDIKSRYYTCLKEVSQFEELRSSLLRWGSKYLILGEGSNILFTKDYDGSIIHMCFKGIDLISEDKRSAEIKVYAGENWDDFVEICVAKGLFGLENLSLIPGSVGSSPVQNIGAYGVEVKDRIINVEGYSLPELKFTVFKNEECRFSYRDSIFKQELKNRFLITAVVFRLDKHPVYTLKYGNLEERFRQKETQNLRTLRETIIEIRRDKLPDPLKFGNAGSFFKNPVIPVSHYNKLKQQWVDIPCHTAGNIGIKVPAAWLIEKAGWKGIRNGDVGTWEFQPLVIVNYGAATGKEILEFSEKIRESVLKKFGVGLEREVNVI